MTEADILSLRSDLTGLVISVVSVSFGMISAYIVRLVAGAEAHAVLLEARRLRSPIVGARLHGRADVGPQRSAFEDE